MHKKLRPKFKILVLKFVEGGMLIRIKNLEISSFKTIGEARSGSHKLIFVVQPPKVGMQCGHAKHIRYDIILLMLPYSLIITLPHATHTITLLYTMT